MLAKQGAAAMNGAFAGPACFSFIYVGKSNRDKKGETHSVRAT
uniref:Uncharacterized protein n=1 Tax=Geobacillus sp. (strain Y4.1MC1) TaxID=581103 RepID=A0A7U3YH53_GEOS0